MHHGEKPHDATGVAVRGRAAAAALSPALLARVARAQGKGTVTVGLPSDILNFDPSAKSFVTYPVIRLVYNKLVDYTAAYQPQAELASSWKVADDFHSASFKLRPWAKFHNGRPMTSKDIVAVFQRAMDPATGQNLVTLTSAQGLRTVRAPDGATVVFTRSCWQRTPCSRRRRGRFRSGPTSSGATS